MHWDIEIFCFEVAPLGHSPAKGQTAGIVVPRIGTGREFQALLLGHLDELLMRRVRHVIDLERNEHSL